jgi:hypothetical protein
MYEQLTDNDKKYIELYHFVSYYKM